MYAFAEATAHAVRNLGCSIDEASAVELSFGARCMWIWGSEDNLKMC